MCVLASSDCGCCGNFNRFSPNDHIGREYQ